MEVPMSEEQGGKKVDPAEQLLAMRDAYMNVWAKSMSEMVNTEAYAQQSGAVLDAFLTVSQPFKASLEKAMVNALQQMSMPTRPDFVSLAERLTNLEMRLDDMDCKLDRIEHAIARLAIPVSPATGTQSAAQPAKKSARKAAK
jgi:hypothetical protein